MVRKNYILSEKSLEIIHQVMEERHLKSETAALEYILLQHNVRQSMEERFAQIIYERYAEVLESTRAAARQTEQAVQLTLDAVNTILIERGYTACYPADREPSPVIEESRRQWKRKLEREKQFKDDRRQKQGGVKK